MYYSYEKDKEVKNDENVEDVVRWQLYYGKDNEAFCEGKFAVVCTNNIDNKAVIDINEEAINIFPDFEIWGMQVNY